MTDPILVFNPPPGWPKPPANWQPSKGWQPDPSWPTPPPDWQLWVPVAMTSASTIAVESAEPVVSETSHCVTAQTDARIAMLEAENRALKARLETLSAGVGFVNLDDEQVIQNVGVYRYHHPLENAPQYRERLARVEQRIDELIKNGQAIETSTRFSFENSLAKGRKMVQELSRLMLRAYNAEVDNSIRALRHGTVLTARRRIESSRESIAKLGSMMQIRISDAYHAFRIEELELTADFLMKKQEERELAREERARFREERRVAEELAAQRALLDKERTHILNTLKALRDDGLNDEGLETKLQTIDEAIAQNDFRTANIRAGYVYVISNRGAFGHNVVKIGLTRRLEPLERIDELGDASVPFRFDVHALFFSEDAVTLEAELHAHFADYRLNRANHRKEFFFATPAEVRAVLASKLGNLLEFNEHAEATEYLQSMNGWPERERLGRG